MKAVSYVLSLGSSGSCSGLGLRDAAAARGADRLRSRGCADWGASADCVRQSRIEMTMSRKAGSVGTTSPGRGPNGTMGGGAADPRVATFGPPTLITIWTDWLYVGLNAAPAGAVIAVSKNVLSHIDSKWLESKWLEPKWLRRNVCVCVCFSTHRDDGASEAVLPPLPARSGPVGQRVGMGDALYRDPLMTILNNQRVAPGYLGTRFLYPCLHKKWVMPPVCAHVGTLRARISASL